MADRHLAVLSAPKMATYHWTQNDPMTWPEFVSWLALDTPASRKDCGGYVLGEFQDTTGHDGKPKCVGLHRAKAGVVSRSAVALDADFASPSFVADSAAELGCAAAFYTTWSHRPEKPRWRLVAPLSRDVTPAEYRLIVQALMVDLGYEQFDLGSAQPERLMHRPSKQGSAYQHIVVDGPLLDADARLARAKDLGLEAAPDRPKREPFIDDSPVRSDSAGVHPYAAKAINDELARLDALPHPWVEGESYWDKTTFEVACNLLEFANSNWSGYSLADAYTDLLDRAPSDEAWGREQHIAKWVSAQNTVENGGRPNPDGTPGDVFGRGLDEESPGDPDSSTFDAEKVKAQFPTLDLVALLDPDRPPRRWVWEDAIPEGDQASVVAPAGVGKSLLILSLCMELVSGGKEFIGRSLDFDGRVLYVDMENSEDDWAERLSDLGWTQEAIRKVVLSGRFIPLSLPPLRGLDTKTGAEQLKAIIAAYGIGKGDLLVLDSTQRVTEGEENSNDTLRALYNLTSAWLKRAGITVIRTDNTGWDQSRERGASAKRDDVGYSLLLEPIGVKSDGRFRLRNPKRRTKGRSDAITFVRTTDADGRLVFVRSVPGDDVTPVGPKAKQQDILLRVWMLTTEDDPRYEADMVSQTTALTGVTGKSDDKRMAMEQLVERGYLKKVPRVNQDGEPSNAPPGIALDDAGREWIEEQDPGWAEARMDELAKQAER